MLRIGTLPWRPGNRSPHDIVPRIADATARASFELLYGRSKDAADLGRLPFLRSRTGNVGNKRVRPAEYLAWAIDSGHPVSPDVKLPKHSPTVEQLTEANPASTSEPRHLTPMKRRVVLARLQGLYPRLKGAMSTNDPSFLPCKVPPKKAPGNVTGFYYLEMVEQVCSAKWNPEDLVPKAPPGPTKLGNF